MVVHSQGSGGGGAAFFADDDDAPNENYDAAAAAAAGGGKRRSIRLGHQVKSMLRRGGSDGSSSVSFFVPLFVCIEGEPSSCLCYVVTHIFSYACLYLNSMQKSSSRLPKIKTSRRSDGGGGSGDHGSFSSSSAGASARPSSARGRLFSRPSPSSGGSGRGKKKQLSKSIRRKTIDGDAGMQYGSAGETAGAASFLDGQHRPSVLSPRNIDQHPSSVLSPRNVVRHNHQQQQYRQPSNHGHSYNPRQQLHPQQRQKFLPPKPMMPAKEDRHNDTNRTSPEPRPRRTVFFPDEEEEEEEEEEKENGGWYISDDEDDDENTIDFVYENDENDTISIRRRSFLPATW